MKQSCETGFQLRDMRFPRSTSAWICPLLLAIFLGSWSHAAQPEPDLRLNGLWRVDEFFSPSPELPYFFFPRETSASVKRTDIPVRLRVLPTVNLRIPISASLQTGYACSFQRDRHDGRFSMDGLGVVPLSQRLTLIGEVHTELESLNFVHPNWLQSRSDWSGGLGLRGMAQKNVMLGVNVFLDKSLLGGRWHKSGGLGMELAAEVSDFPREVFDLAVNLHKGGGIDTEAGFSVTLGKDIDLRVAVGKYRFYDGEYLLGWKAGANINVYRDLITLSYQFDQDRDRSACHTIGAALSANLNLEDLFSGSWPFEWPKKQSVRETPFAASMGNRVKRNWHQPDSFVTFASQSRALWNAPGVVRFDADDGFSPTISVFKGFFCGSPQQSEDNSGRKAKQSDTSLIDQLAFVAIGAVTTVTTGVVEYGYRSLFGPFKTDSKTKPKPVSSAH